MLPRRLDTGAGWFLLAGFAAIAPLPAAAAPQVLALIATDRPVALHCEGAMCTASLPTLCLQPERRAPRAGRDYRLAANQALTLVGNGKTRSIAEGFHLIAKRTHVAVEIRIPRTLIAGLANPAILVGAGVSAVPVGAADDPRPMNADELALAIGPRRAVATVLVDRDPARIPAVSMTNRLANLVSANGEDRQRWSEIVADAKARKVSAAAIDYAKIMHDLCGFKLRNRLVGSLPSCLAALNDEAMDYLNGELEPALKTGS